ncbi:MAG: lysylphosphatidylglycerol synthase transmembrane domain-containing protein [Gemmatimonadales bacterium]
MNAWYRAGAFALGALVFAILIIHSGPVQLWHAVRGSLWVVGPIVALWAVVYAANARAWQLLMPDRSPELTFWRAYRITVSSFAINYATPVFSMGGEPVKVAAATPLVGRHRAVGSVVGFRFLHSISHIIVFLIAVIPAAIFFPHTPAVLASLALAATVLILIGWFLLSRHRDGIFEQGVALLGRLGPLRKLAARLESHRTTLQALDHELTAIHSAPGHFRWALITELSGRVLCTMEYAFILYGFGFGVDPLRAFVIANVSSMFTNLLFFLPFEMGAKEGGAYATFAWMGLDPALGTSAALLSRARELVWMAIGITLLLWAEKRSPRRRRKSRSQPRSS